MTTPPMVCPECSAETSFELMIEDGEPGRPCECGDPASAVPSPPRAMGYRGGCGCELHSGTWALVDRREGDVIVVEFTRVSA